MDEDAYDLEDDFIDDGDVHAYFDRDEASTKHKGFFINAGGLERDSSQRSGGSSLRSPGSAAGVSPSIQKKMRAGGYKNLSAHQKALVKKLIPEVIGKEIEKACFSIYPMQNVFIRKVKVVSRDRWCDKEQINQAYRRLLFM